VCERSLDLGKATKMEGIILLFYLVDGYREPNVCILPLQEPHDA
jgi:hypothetical protein